LNPSADHIVVKDNELYDIVFAVSALALEGDK